MKFSYLVLVVLCAITPLANAEILIPKKEIIRPSEPVELSDFSVEACGEADGQTDLNTICFGHGVFQKNVRVRGIQLNFKNGLNTYFVENDLPGVELLKPVFTAIGPIGGTFVGVSKAETAQVAIRYGSEGEVEALKLSSTNFGEVIARFNSQSL